VILSSTSRRVNEGAGDAFGSARSKLTTSCLPRSSTRIGVRLKTAGANPFVGKTRARFLENNLPVMRDRLYRAEVRLATELNECFE
jgi:hypothetical protein